MPENSEDPNLSDLYWQTRRMRLDNPNGKKNAVLAAAQLVKMTYSKLGQVIRILELGCGEGHLLASLVEICRGDSLLQEYVGVDCRGDVIERARHLYPTIRFTVADYTTKAVLGLGRFSVVILVNTVHEVYSSDCIFSLERIDQSSGKCRVANALTNVVKLVENDGYLVLFDGVEPPLNPELRVVIRFRSSDALNEFISFVNEYEALPITYKEIGERNRIEISVRDFTRYITKTIFLGTPLWKVERKESYQYYSEADFRTILDTLGFVIEDLKYLSPSREHWQHRVVIETPGVDFPNEHILIVAKRRTNVGFRAR